MAMQHKRDEDHIERLESSDDISALPWGIFTNTARMRRTYADSGQVLRSLIFENA
jgi:hypothetical protein